YTNQDTTLSAHHIDFEDINLPRKAWKKQHKYRKMIKSILRLNPNERPTIADIITTLVGEPNIISYSIRVNISDNLQPDEINDISRLRLDKTSHDIFLKIYSSYKHTKNAAKLEPLECMIAFLNISKRF